MEAKIKEFLESLPPAKRKLVMRVRGVVLKTDPSIKEAVKWGNLTFTSNGNIAFIYTYHTKDYINLGFFKGTELSDPGGLLEGTGKAMRHTKIQEEEDINEGQISQWIKQAIEINRLDTRSSKERSPPSKKLEVLRKK